LTRIIAETRYDRVINTQSDARKAFAAGWNGWRIFAVDVVPDEDELSRVNVFIDPASGPSQFGMTNLSFLIDAKGRGSKRLEALTVACSGSEVVTDLVGLEGRYFAARDNGRTADDFGSLALALQAAA
jgi:hypothetical protein